jgi:signal transduction histidine kinase
MSFALVVLLLSLLLAPAGWPQMVLAGLVLAVVVWQGMVNHKRTDELIYGQYRLTELAQELRVKQAVIERQNTDLATLVDRRTAELRDANVRLAAANLELLELDRLRSALLSNVSHELRTPLTGILGSAQNLRDGLAGGLNRAQHEYVAMIEHDSGRLIRVVNELLDLGRLDAGRIRLERAPVDVRELLDEVVILMRSAAERGGVTVELPGRDAALICADTDKLKQILINLLDNAIKFSRPRGTVSLSVTTGGDSVRVTVRDHGPGIAAADLPHVFERFYRGQSAATTTTGTGLGLAIARNLARLHGGDITVESAPQRGSTFTLSLPLASAPVEPSRPLAETH